MNYNTYHIFFRNLANPLKIKIITELKTKSLTVTELTNKIKEEQSKVSHALANLRFCNLVISETKGKQRVYSLNKDTILPILKIIDNHKGIYCKGGCNAK